MPLFTNKFVPKKTPVRKSLITEIGRDSDSINEKELLENDDSVIRLLLGDHETIFENGEWISGSEENQAMHKTNQKLRKQVQALKEENNLLKLKFNILLDMLTQTTAENHLQQRELEKLRRSGTSANKTV